jgi:nucleoside-diphosphate-sugar epimerase
MFVLGPVLAGEVASWPGDPDAPKGWHYTEDIAATLVAASRNDRAWGHAWHVPATAAMPVRELTERLADLAGAPAPQINRLYRHDLITLARQQPLFGELVEILYSNEAPNVLDSAHTEEVLGVTATPLETVLQATLAGTVDV